MSTALHARPGPGAHRQASELILGRFLTSTPLQSGGIGPSGRTECEAVAIYR